MMLVEWCGCFFVSGVGVGGRDGGGVNDVGGVVLVLFLLVVLVMVLVEVVVVV